MEIIDASGAAHIWQALMPHLDAPTDRYWDAIQRCRVAYHLAQRGEPEDRRRLYSCFRKWPDSADVIGAKEIIDLDGVDGLVHAARYLGTLLQKEPDFWVDGNPLRWFDDTHEAGSARRVLDAAAAQSPLIALYLHHLDERDQAQRNASEGVVPGRWYLSLDNVRLDPSGQRPHAERMQRISAAEVIQAIETEDPQENRFWFLGWGRHAPEHALLPVFDAMVAQSDPGRLCKYLRVFGRRALSALDTRLLRYADHDNSDVRQLTLRALSNYTHPDVRQLAIERLRAGQFVENELKLLEKNYQPGDAKLIENILGVPEDREQVHDLSFDLVHLYETNQVPESANLMQFVYEESPCSNCRCNAVEILIATGSAPDWLLDECRRDSSNKTRAMAATKS